jgi:hypothetical protein
MWTVLFTAQWAEISFGFLQREVYVTPKKKREVYLAALMDLVSQLLGSLHFKKKTPWFPNETLVSKSWVLLKRKMSLLNGRIQGEQINNIKFSRFAALRAETIVFPMHCSHQNLMHLALLSSHVVQKNIFNPNACAPGSTHVAPPHRWQTS